MPGGLDPARTGSIADPRPRGPGSTDRVALPGRGREASPGEPGPGRAGISQRPIDSVRHHPWIAGTDRLERPSWIRRLSPIKLDHSGPTRRLRVARAARFRSSGGGFARLLAVADLTVKTNFRSARPATLGRVATQAPLWRCGRGSRRDPRRGIDRGNAARPIAGAGVNRRELTAES
jgi:hypothetical protein